MSLLRKIKQKHRFPGLPDSNPNHTKLRYTNRSFFYANFKRSVVENKPNITATKTLKIAFTFQPAIPEQELKFFLKEEMKLFSLQKISIQQ